MPRGVACWRLSVGWLTAPVAQEGAA